jgi:predicted PurR-regulated permease PerM
MGVVTISEDQKLLLLIGMVFLIATVAFWPLMTVFVWAIALASALMPLHKRFLKRVKPSVSATFITLGVVLLILVVSSLAAGVLYADLEFIGSMVAAMVQGLQNTGFSAFLPTFTAAQLSDMPETLVQMMLQTLLSTTENPMLFVLQIIILFLTLSMLVYYGEQIWRVLTRNLSPKLSSAVDKMAEITENTIYSLIIIQVSAAVIAFILAVPFFYFLGYGHEFLFATMVGFGMLIPLIGAQLVLVFFMLYLLALGDLKGMFIVMFIGYPLLSGWIDFYYRPVMMRRRVAVHPVFMIIGIFAGVPFMGFVGFIIGPVLVSLAAVCFKIYADRTRTAAVGEEFS